MALKPIHDELNIELMNVATYQAVSGTGKAALEELHNQTYFSDSSGPPSVYPKQIAFNVIPQCDVFLDNDFTKEEMKLSNETHKILDKTIKVSATAIRIPVIGGHSESINLSLNNPFEIEDIKTLLDNTTGVELKDDIDNFDYPMPLYSKGKDEVFVGRIRKDFSEKNSLNLWVVADNLRKGAATNTIQIAEKIIEKGYLNN